MSVRAVGADASGAPLYSEWKPKEGVCAIPGSHNYHFAITYHGANFYINNIFKNKDDYGIVRNADAGFDSGSTKVVDAGDISMLSRLLLPDRRDNEHVNEFFLRENASRYGHANMLERLSVEGGKHGSVVADNSNETTKPLILSEELLSTTSLDDQLLANRTGSFSVSSIFPSVRSRSKEIINLQPHDTLTMNPDAVMLFGATDSPVNSQVTPTSVPHSHNKIVSTFASPSIRNAAGKENYHSYARNATSGVYDNIDMNAEPLRSSDSLEQTASAKMMLPSKYVDGESDVKMSTLNSSKEFNSKISQLRHLTPHSNVQFNKPRFVNKSVNKYNTTNIYNVKFNNLDVYNINGTSFINLNSRKPLDTIGADVPNTNIKFRDFPGKSRNNKQSRLSQNLIYLVNYGTINILQGTEDSFIYKDNDSHPYEELNQSAKNEFSPKSEHKITADVDGLRVTTEMENSQLPFTKPSESKIDSHENDVGSGYYYYTNETRINTIEPELLVQAPQNVASNTHDTQMELQSPSDMPGLRSSQQLHKIANILKFINDTANKIPNIDYQNMKNARGKSLDGFSLINSAHAADINYSSSYSVTDYLRTDAPLLQANQTGV